MISDALYRGLSKSLADFLNNTVYNPKVNPQLGGDLAYIWDYLNDAKNILTLVEELADEEESYKDTAYYNRFVKLLGRMKRNKRPRKKWLNVIEQGASNLIFGLYEKATGNRIHAEVVLSSGQRQRITKPFFYIGGESDNDIRIVIDNTVSRRHMRITFHEGRFHVHDLKSKNGTWVNGEEVSERELEDGDKIKIGDTQIIFAMGPVQEKIDELVEANLRLMTSNEMGGMPELIIKESRGGNAGTWEVNKKKLPCTGANFYYDRNTGAIQYFENFQLVPTEIRERFSHGIFRLAIDFPGSGKYRIVQIHIEEMTPLAKEVIGMSAIFFNKRHGFGG